MVSILPAERTPFDVIGKDVGQALQSVLPGAMQQMGQRAALQRSLDEIKQIAANPNASPMDITLAAMKAGAGIPGSERYLGALIPELVKFAEARRSQQTPLAGEEPIQPRTHEPVEPVSARPQAPPFAGIQETQNFPTTTGPQGGPGNAPQAATAGQKLPILTPQELMPKARELANERTKSGIPTTVKEAYEELKEAEKDKKLYNKAIDEELAQRVQSQQDYGERAAKYLKGVLPNATPEQQAIFQKYGENVSTKGKSEADINAYLAKKATDFANSIDTVKKDMSAPRFYNEIHRRMLGDAKSFDKAAEDLRVKLKPILDLGLYDTARDLLKNLGYYPEERETVINPLSERQKTILNKVPEAIREKKPEGQSQIRLFPEYTYSPNEIKNVKAALQDMKDVDPNFSLVLARKALEDKKYDWRVVKDALNELQQQGFELTTDQQIQQETLDHPPLNGLQRILHGLNLIGR